MFDRFKFSRRNFLQMGAGVTSALLAGKHLRGVAYGREALSRTSQMPLKGIATTCGECPVGCGVFGHLDGNELARITGNELHPQNMGRLCARGIAAINRVYDPERLKYHLYRYRYRCSIIQVHQHSIQNLLW